MERHSVDDAAVFEMLREFPGKLPDNHRADACIG